MSKYNETLNSSLTVIWGSLWQNVFKERIDFRSPNDVKCLQMFLSVFAHVLTLWVTRMLQRWDSICSPSVNPPSVGIIKISWTPMYTENNSIIRRFTIKAIPATIWLRVRVLSTAPGNPRLSHAAFRDHLKSSFRFDAIHHVVCFYQ